FMRNFSSLLELVIDPGAGQVSGDPSRLQQVVWNLLSNAVKFTPRGGLIQVRLERVESAVEIVVSDTGAGIAPEFLPRVFDQFAQADVGLTRATGGLGLGLSIVRHLVEMHGGKVHAGSPGVGRGATFRVQLPTRLSHAHIADRPSLATSSVPVALASLQGLLVLAVDDEPEARAVLRTILESAGATVEVAASGREALEYLKAHRPNVLVADIGMPVMDGFALISHLRQFDDATVRDLPAAALTALARPEDRTRALRAGFEMHLAKPVDPGELVASVATLARRRRQ
ncbi:MAG: ATP-binding protein, partial [Acidobacteriota bacterium]